MPAGLSIAELAKPPDTRVVRFRLSRPSRRELGRLASLLALPELGGTGADPPRPRPKKCPSGEGQIIEVM